MNYPQPCSLLIDPSDVLNAKQSFGDDDTSINTFDCIFDDNSQVSTDLLEFDHILAGSIVSDDMSLDPGSELQEEPEWARNSAVSLMHTSCNGMHIDCMQGQENAMGGNQPIYSCGNTANIISSGSLDHDEDPQVHRSGCHNSIQSKNVTPPSTPKLAAIIQVENNVDFEYVPMSSDRQHQQNQRRPPSCSGVAQLRHQGVVSPVQLSPLMHEVSINSVTAQEPRSSRPQRRITTDSPVPPYLDQLLHDKHVVGSDGTNGSNVHEEVSTDNALYRAAVHKLAQSMRRTELSRRQLAMLGVPTLQPPPQAQPQPQPQPRAIVTNAQQQLQQRAEGAPRDVNFSMSSLVDEALSTTNASNVVDFLSGRRSTLTDGLERSRKQLKEMLLLDCDCWNLRR